MVSDEGGGPLIPMTSVGAEATIGEGGNFQAATEPPAVNPVTRLRDRAAMAREDHVARMARGSDFVIAVVRPRWVVILGVTAATQRKADRWQAACNVAFAFVVMLASAFIARGVLGVTPLMILAAYTAPLLVLKLIRIQLTPPFGEDSDDNSKQDEGYEVG